MNKNDFINKALQIANSKTAYAYGFTGQTITPELIAAKMKQYPAWYTPERVKTLNSKCGYMGFDCSGLIKYLCNALGDPIKDINADSIYKTLCTPTNKAYAGCLAHKAGHIGIVIDDERVIESSSASGGVVISSVNNPKWKEFGAFNLLTNDATIDDLIADIERVLSKYKGV